MANNQENQTVTDGSQNAGQTVTANTGTVSTANSPITGPVIAAPLAANSVTPQSIIANAATADKLAANSVDEMENGPDWKALSRKHEKQAKDNTSSFARPKPPTRNPKASCTTCRWRTRA